MIEVAEGSFLPGCLLGRGRPAVPRFLHITAQSFILLDFQNKAWLTSDERMSRDAFLLTKSNLKEVWL
jgi:hypothetical protein